MATITSVGTGAWSAAGTWDSGVPVDGDDVVIASGHTVTFDVDQSAFTTGVKVTITGTLTHTTTTGTYCLFAKTGASIVGAGTWNIGTSGTPIPFAAKHTITGAAGWYVDGNDGLTMTVYGAEPSIKYVKLSGDEAIGQTELSVDTDVTGDIWADGDIVRIDDINRAKESEERVIAAGGIAAGAITVTAGLTLAKSTGAIVSLITRNVKIIAVGTGAQTIFRVGTSANKLTIGGGMFYGISNKSIIKYCYYSSISGGSFSGTSGFALENCHNSTISGGTFSGCNQLLRSCNNTNISGGLFSGNTMTYGLGNGEISGGEFYGTQGFSSTSNVIISGGTWYGNSSAFSSCTNVVISGGTFTSNASVVATCTNVVVTGGTFISNANGINTVNNLVLTGATFTSNTNDLVTITNGRIYNIALTGTTEHRAYTSMPTLFNTQSENHDGVDGALKAWCKGGVVTSQVTVKPDGYTQAYLLDPESATYPVFFTKQFSVEPSKTVNVVVQLRKDASMTYLPRVYLMASIGNPLAGATPVDTFTMTDSTNTWESDTFTIANSTNYDQDYTLYFVAQNASGNAYAAYDITTEGGTGGGGAVSIQPISGRLGL